MIDSSMIFFSSESEISPSINFCATSKAISAKVLLNIVSQKNGGSCGMVWGKYRPPSGASPFSTASFSETSGDCLFVLKYFISILGLALEIGLQ